MRRDEFESAVQHAVAQQMAQRQPPKLVKAHYIASVSSGRLSGSGEWSLVYPKNVGGLVDIAPLGIAVWNARWASQPAIIFHKQDDDNIKSTLLAGDPQESSLQFEWSADGIVEPQIDRYKLILPAAALSTLDLELASDLEPIVGQHAFATGPYTSDSPNRKRWHIAIGNTTLLNLGIRKAGNASTVAIPIHCERLINYQCNATELKIAYQYTLSAIREPIRMIAFDVDPGLHVIDIACEPTQSPCTWNIIQGKSQKEASTVHLQFSEPVSTAKLTILAASASPPAIGQSWTLPGMHLQNGILAMDAITLEFDKSVQLKTCDPRDYRITEATPARQSGCRLSLIGTMLQRTNGQSSRLLPVISLHAGDASYTTQEELYWRVDANRTSLYAKLQMRIEQGPCAEWNLQIPSGFRVQSVEMEPEDPGIEWVLNPTTHVVNISPSHAIATGEAITLHIELKGQPIIPQASGDSTSSLMRRISFPNVILQGVTNRTGNYTIDVGPSLSTSAALRSDSVEQRSKHNNRNIINYSYTGSIPEGVLHCHLPRTDITVHIESEFPIVNASLDRTTIHRINLQSSRGLPDDILLIAPLPPQSSWSIQVQEPFGCDVRKILSSQDLVLLNHVSNLTIWNLLTQAVTSQLSAFEVWQIHRPSPISRSIDIQAKLSTPQSSPTVAMIQTPIPIVCGVDPVTYIHNMHPNHRHQFDHVHLSRIPYPLLTVHRRSLTPHTAPLSSWEYDNLIFSAHLHAGGAMNCTLKGRIVKCANPTFVVDLPDEAQLLSLSVDGKIVTGFMPSSSHPGRLEFRLPVDSGKGIPFEIHYQIDSRFRGFWSWVRCSAPLLSGGISLPRPTWSYDSNFVGYDQLIPSRWNMIHDFNYMLIITTDALNVFGFMLASILLSVGLGIMSIRRRSGRIILALILAGIGSIAWFAPDTAYPLTSPPIIVGLLLLCGYWANQHRPSPSFGSTVSYAGHHHISRQSATRSSLPVMLFLAGTVAMSCQMTSPAQTPTPAVVTFSLSRDSKGLPHWEAMVPQAVWDRLTRLRRPILDIPVITTAEYNGDVRPSHATLEAVFHVFNPTATQKILTIPLDHTRIREVTLNTKPALLDMLEIGCYAVTIDGFGMHTLRVRFEVSVTSSNGVHELRFGTPNIPASRVALQLPQNAQQPHVVSARGSQVVQQGRILADLGSGNEFIMRWRGHASDSQTAMTVRAASLWDLHESYSQLLTVFNIRIDGGSKSEFRITIPEGLEPGNILVRPADLKMLDSQLGLRDCRLLPGNPGMRTLHLTLRTPITGRIIIQLNLYPRSPLSARPTLYFPQIFDTSDTESYFAIRTRDIQIEDINRVGMIDYPADALTKDFVAISPELGLDRQPVLRVFRSLDSPQPRILPVMRPQAAPISGSTEIHWDIGSVIRAKGLVKTSFTAGTRGWVEFELPAAVTITEVRAADMMGWGRTGNRVQVWFQKPTANATVHWSGQLQKPRFQMGHPVPVPLTLPLPRVGMLGRDATVSLKITTSNGWTVEAGDTDQLVPQPAPMDGTGEYFLVTKPGPSVPFLAYPPQAVGGAHIVDVMNLASSSVVYQSTIDIPVRPGRPQTVVVGITGHVPEAKAELRGHAGTILSILRAQPGDQAWTVRTERHATSSVRLTLTLRQSAQLEPRIPLVTIWLGDDPYPIANRLLVVEGQSLIVFPSRLKWDTTDAEREHLLKLFPDEANRLRHARVTHVPHWLTAIRLRSDEQTPSTILPPESAVVPPLGISTPPSLPPDSSPRPMSLMDQVIPGVGLFGWVMGLLGLCLYLPHPSQWAYRLVVCGILGAMVMGLLSPAGRFFLVLAAVGIVWLMLRMLMRISAIRR
ncbi:MAG: hypothetical protein LC104_21990 [Bacteroidales bacterium]|nr:hypothetical protein [Bacteroidales bacterium]